MECKLVLKKSWWYQGLGLTFPPTVHSAFGGGSPVNITSKLKVWPAFTFTLGSKLLSSILGGTGIAQQAKLDWPDRHNPPLQEHRVPFQSQSFVRSSYSFGLYWHSRHSELTSPGLGFDNWGWLRGSARPSLIDWDYAELVFLAFVQVLNCGFQFIRRHLFNLWLRSHQHFSQKTTLLKLLGPYGQGCRHTPFPSHQTLASSQWCISVVVHRRQTWAWPTSASHNPCHSQVPLVCLACPVGLFESGQSRATMTNLILRLEFPLKFFTTFLMNSSCSE